MPFTMRLMAFVCVALAGLQAAAAQGEKRVALVIGNAAYRAVAELPNPKKDARDVAEALRGAAFGEVVERYDLGVREMQQALAQFEDKATGADWAVVYYAGHAIEVDGRNYLVPVDAELRRATDVEDETLALDRVLARVAAARKLQLVVLDACRFNPFRQRMAGMGTRAVGERGLGRIEPAQPNVIVAYAARDGQVALDGKAGDNSPYARALVKHLGEPGLELQRLFRKVREDVMAETGGQQRPYEYGSLIGPDLFFRPAPGGSAPPASVAPAAVAATIARPSEGAEAWAAVKDSTSVAELEVVATRFNGTVYGDLARARIEELRKQQMAATIPPPVSKPAAGSSVQPTVGIFAPPRGSPIKIGYSMAMTGGLGPNGKSALLAQRIWEEDVNKKGGLLGRPVKLIYYDDQTNPSTVPGIYAKLLDVDKVDLIIGGYATNMLAPAMPLVIQRRKVFIGLLGLGINTEFRYPNYFAIIPSGPNLKGIFTKGFFDVAMAQSPRPRTVAIVAADAEFARSLADGARENANRAGLRIVYDESYPAVTNDFAPIVRGIAATNPDLVVIGSYPPDSVGMVRAVNEVGFKPSMIGGGMVGLQNTAIKTGLGPLLNGWVNYDFWLPVPGMMFSGAAELIRKYQALASSANVDPLGYYMAPPAYAQMQVLEQAVNATSSLDDQRLADYIRANRFKTVLGDIRFGRDGEWSEPRILLMQFRGIRQNGLSEFKRPDTQVVVWPSEFSSGALVYPFERAR